MPSARSAAASASGRSTCPTAGPSTIRITSTNWRGWRRSRTRWHREVASGTPLAICGDFNVAPTDADVWDPAAFVGSTHVTEPERHALTELLGLGLVDIVPKPMKGPNPFTYWDYRAGMFHKDMGMRIDLVYATESIAGGVENAYIDREARKGKGPSDHAPVVVDFTV